MTTLAKQTTSKLDAAYAAALLLPMDSVERKRMFAALNGLDAHLEKLREHLITKNINLEEEAEL